MWASLFPRIFMRSDQIKQCNQVVALAERDGGQDTPQIDSKKPPRPRAQGHGRRAGNVMTRQGEFERIIASLHRAMLDESEWHTTLALIDDACGTAGIRFAVVDDNDPGDAQWIFDDACCRHDEPAQRHFDGEPLTAPTRNELLCHARANGLNIRVAGTDGTHSLWALARLATACGLNPQQIAMIERLLPHVRHFLRVRHALAGDAALGASLIRVLDNMLIGVLCLDWRAMIVHANVPRP